MINGQPDYKLLYEESQKRLAETENKAHKQIQSLALAELNARQEVAELKQQLHLALLDANALRRKLFGIKADNRVTKASQDQLELFTLGATAQDIAQSEQELEKEIKEVSQQQEATAEKRKRAPRTASRMVLPETLEREEVIIDPQGDLSNYAVIGEDVTEVLVLTPASFKVKRIIRRRWALKDKADTESKGVLIAPIPSRTVKRGLFDESVLVYLLVSKYLDHLPLNRQMKIFRRAGINIPASTLSDNTAAVCQVLLPLYLALKRELLCNLYLQADETTIKVLKSGSPPGEKKSACHLGYYWAVHAPIDNLVLFEYQQGRGQEGPKKLFQHFSGVVQSDGYKVYQALFKKSTTVNQLYCMAHIRRKFDEAFDYDNERSTHAVKQIAKLYGIEKFIKEASPEFSETQIVEKRMAEATPILHQMKAWMLSEYPKVLPKSPIGKALAYALRLWDNMHYYTLHGHLQIDNNAIENAIRPIALGRKNYLFAGTHDAAQNAAMIYSLFATCKKQNVNEQEWLTDVLRKMNDPNYEGKFSDLLPHRWKDQKAMV